MRCPRCYADNADERRTCGACGASLDGERRQLTVLFCDLVGSTALSSQLDPEDLREVVRTYQEAAAAAIARHEGHIAQYLGDGLLVYFGFPGPHEDDPARAVRAGLEIIRAVRDLAVPAVRLPESLQVRVGIHTGLVVVGEVGGGDRHEQLALGETPNIAARLQSAAEPNAVLISDATRRLVEGLFDCEALGPQSLKGLARPIPAHRVRAARGVQTRFEVSLWRGLTPLVGRREELDTLAESWRAARAGVRAVNVVGEAGIGKSRLLHEFGARVSGEEAFFLRGHCTSEGQATPFLPFIELVRTSFRIGDADPQTEEKLTRGLELLGLSGDETLPYLLHLLGRAPASVQALDSEILGLRTRGALQALLEGRCRLSPTVLIVEDLHWIDTAAEEYLQWAAEPGRPLSLLVVCTYRPVYRPPWAGRPNVTELHLTPLSRTSTIELVTSRLGTAGLPPGLQILVAEKAEGNPLFAEELATYLQETATARGAEPVSARDVVLPVTLENLLMERIGRLPDGPRTVLQTAAVIGRRFSLDLVRRVSRLDGAVPQWLRDLERQELVFREADVDAFAFKHALVRDAAYQNLLKARREELHERVAGETDAALEYAEASIRSSLSPIDRLYARLARALALVLSGETRESLPQLEELRRQAEAGEMRMPGLGTAELPYSLALVLAGEWGKGVRWIEAAVRRYKAWGQPFARALGDQYLGLIYLKMAEGGPRPPLAVVLRNLGFALKAVPFAARLGRRHLETAAHEYRRLNMPYYLAECLFHLGVLHQAKGRTREARVCFDEARKVAAAVEASALCERIDAARSSLAA